MVSDPNPNKICPSINTLPSSSFNVLNSIDHEKRILKNIQVDLWEATPFEVESLCDALNRASEEIQPWSKQMAQSSARREERPYRDHTNVND